METQNSASEKFEKSINQTSQALSEVSSAMADVYSKQFKMGNDMLTNLMGTGLKARNNGSDFDYAPFSSGVDMMYKNIQDFTDQTQKTMSALVKPDSGQSTTLIDGENYAESTMRMYSQQTKHISDFNSRLMKIYSETFKASNENINKLYKLFRGKVETNQRIADEETNSSMANYTSSVNKSAKDAMDMFEEINKQVGALAKNNQKLWSDLLQFTEKENEKENGKRSSQKQKRSSGKKKRKS